MQIFIRNYTWLSMLLLAPYLSMFSWLEPREMILSLVEMLHALLHGNAPSSLLC
jgi:hypothetical protein